MQGLEVGLHWRPANPVRATIQQNINIRILDVINLTYAACSISPRSTGYRRYQRFYVRRVHVSEH